MVQIHFQGDNSRPADRGPANYQCALPAKMPHPFMPADFNSRTTLLVLGSTPATFRPLMAVARKTGQARLPLASPLVLFGDDVIHLEGEIEIDLGNLAESATPSGPKPHQPFQRSKSHASSVKL